MRRLSILFLLFTVPAFAQTDQIRANKKITVANKPVPVEVSSLAALKAMARPEYAMMAILSGRLAAGDGGEGVFRWDSSDLSASVTADTLAGIYVPPDSDTTGSSGAWVRQYSGSVLPGWWGAKGDGATDDTAAIQAAIATGRGILLPRGTYVVTAGFYPKSNTQIRGERGATIKAAGATGFPFMNLSNVHDVIVEDLTFDGDVPNRAIGSGIQSGLHINHGSYNNTIRRVTVTNCGVGGNGLTIEVAEDDDSDTHTNVIENCLINDPNGQLSFGIRVATNWSLSKNSSEYVRFTRNNTIRDNRIIGTTWNAIEIAGPATMHNTITGNHAVASLGNTGIEADKGASYNVFSDNHVNNVVAIGTSPFAGFRCQGGTGDFPTRYAVGNTFANNTVSRNTKHPSRAFVGMIIDYAERTTVHALHVIDNFSLSHVSETLNGIQIYEAADTQITDYVFHQAGSASAKYGILGNENVVDLSIVNASITLVPDGTVDQAIRLTDGATGLTVTGSLLSGGQSGIAVSTAGRSVTQARISGNKFIGHTYAPVNIGLTGSALSGVVSGNIFDTTGTYAIRANDASALIAHGNISNTAVLDYAGRSRQFGNARDSGTSIGNRAVSWGTSAPASGSWLVGDVVYNTGPAAKSFIGWICTSAGSPGTWVPFGLINTTTWNATASVADGGTITHGSGGTPTAVLCTPSVAAEMCSVTAKDETTFTVALKKHDGTAGTSQTIYWMALR
jgi:hypothetical protein